MPGSRRGAPHTVFLPPWFMLFLSRGGPPKPFILASYSHKDIKKKTQQKELLGMAVKCFIRKAGRGNRVTLYALAQQSEAWVLEHRLSSCGAWAYLPCSAWAHVQVRPEAHTRSREQAHRRTGGDLFVSRLPNRCTWSEGPRPLSSGKDVLGLPCSPLFFVSICQEFSCPVHPGRTSSSSTSVPRSFPLLALRCD